MAADRLLVAREAPASATSMPQAILDRPRRAPAPGEKARHRGPRPTLLHLVVRSLQSRENDSDTRTGLQEHVAELARQRAKREAMVEDRTWLNALPHTYA